MRCRRWIVCVFSLLLSAALCMNVGAVYINDQYLYNSDGESVPSKAAYVPAFSRFNLGLRNPSDMFISGDLIYIADTGRDRIMVVNSDFEYVRDMDTLIPSPDNPESETMLNRPSGMFVDQNNDIYICDTENNRAVKIDQNGNILCEFTKPDTAVLSDDIIFKPLKIAADTAGYVYILADGIYQGFLQYSATGEFLGFFGSNRIELTSEVLALTFKKWFFGKETGETITRLISLEYSNIFISQEDFIYAPILKTSTLNNNLKMLNAKGDNILSHEVDKGQIDKNKYGDLQLGYSQGQLIDTQLVDAYVDGNGIITVLDSTRCRAFQYNHDGDLLCVFGGKGNSLGRLQRPVAVEKLGDRYLILDNFKSSITVYEPTEYGNLLTRASMHYDKGEFQESVKVWQEILKYNNNITLAYKSIGKAYLQQKQTKLALEYLKISGDRKEYSSALEEYRKEFVERNMVWIVLAAAAIIIALIYGYRFLRKWLGFGTKTKRLNIQ